MSYDIILFDLDGTLTDSAEGIVNSVIYALDAKGIPYSSKQELRRFVGPPLKDSFCDYCHFSEEEATDAVRIFREYFTEKGIYENKVYNGVPEMLDALYNAGFTLAVATSKPEAFAKQILERFDLAKYFTVISGASMNGTGKTEVIHRALERIGVTPSSSVLMVGDREHDILGAKEAGISSLGVLYGYGSETELNTSNADHIVQTPWEIVSYCTSSR
jgi:phosphoglycolate phosphatase